MPMTRDAVVCFDGVRILLPVDVALDVAFEIVIRRACIAEGTKVEAVLLSEFREFCSYLDWLAGDDVDKVPPWGVGLDRLALQSPMQSARAGVPRFAAACINQFASNGQTSPGVAGNKRKK